LLPEIEGFPEIRLCASTKKYHILRSLVWLGLKKVLTFATAFEEGNPNQCFWGGYLKFLQPCPLRER
jgi:hypothetical protein